MNKEAQLAARYLELRNRQIDLVREAVSIGQQAEKLAKKATDKLERLDGKYPESVALTDAVDYAEITIQSELESILDVGEQSRPLNVESSVRKIWKEANLPSEEQLEKIRAGLREFIGLINEQIAYTNVIDGIYREMGDLHAEASDVLEEIERSSGSALAEQLEEQYPTISDPSGALAHEDIPKRVDAKATCQRLLDSIENEEE